MDKGITLLIDLCFSNVIPVDIIYCCLIEVSDQQIESSW